MKKTTKQPTAAPQVRREHWTTADAAKQKRVRLCIVAGDHTMAVTNAAPYRIDIADLPFPASKGLEDIEPDERAHYLREHKAALADERKARQRIEHAIASGQWSRTLADMAQAAAAEAAERKRAEYVAERAAQLEAEERQRAHNARIRQAEKEAAEMFGGGAA